MLNDFLQPANINLQLNSPQQWGRCLQIYNGTLPDFSEVDIALIGVKEERGAVNNKGCSQAPDEVRKHLYKLFNHHKNARIADLGNIMPGASKNDTYVALSRAIEELRKADVVPIIIGGSHDLTYPQYIGYENLEEVINVVVADEKIDIYPEQKEMDSGSFLIKLLTGNSSYLFNYSHLGYQSYFVEQRAIDVLDKLNFDCFRLGELRHDLQEIEPIVRDADMLSFDISAIRQSDAPGNKNASPNGFYGEEACQIARYAGMSDKLSSFGIYEYNPEADRAGQTAQLIAQMIWYFTDGYYNRKKENLLKAQESFVKYRVSFKDRQSELTFWKSKSSERWWMEIPFTKNEKLRRHHFIPCSYHDYQQACKEEVPEKWVRAYQKLY